MLSDESSKPTFGIAARGSVGGVLMGLANLVPGISGGTMLLAVGIYPQFIRAVAEVSTLKLRAPSLVLLASVAGFAVVAIVALAGLMKGLVINHSWVMYALFIGLTLGGVPLLWRLVRPLSATVAIAAVAGVAAMVALTVIQGSGREAGDSDAQRRFLMLLVAGAAGGSAMILPGVSGAYLLIVLGQWVVILGAIDSARQAVGEGDWTRVGESMAVFAPVAVGVLIGVVGVSNVIKVCLQRFRRATLGVLLGLLLGAVAGLWPFQTLTVLEDGSVARVGYFTPSVLQAVATVALVGAGFALSMGVAMLGGPDPRQDTREAA